MKSNEMTPEHKSVLDLLMTGKQYTQADIMRILPDLGCHPKYEGNIVKDVRESTLRKIRKLVRDLRLKFNIPILENTKGYWIIKNYDEGVEYINRIEKRARAQAEAHLKTYKGMRDLLQVTNKYFEDMDKAKLPVVPDKPITDVTGQTKLF